MEEQTDYTTKVKTIFRTIKNEDHPFVMIDRRPVENPALSWGAKGVLSYLLSRPDNWTVRLRDLVNRSTDGVYKIRGYIKELKHAGHIHSVPKRDPKTKRILEYTLEVYELPFSTKPLTNLPQAGLPQAGNLMLNDTNINKKKDKNIKPAATPKEPTPPEILVFREVTRLYPPKPNWGSVVKIIQSVSKRIGRAVTADDLRPFFEAWTFRGNKPTNINWTSWAVSGVIPQQYNNKQQQAEPKGFDAARQFLAAHGVTDG